MLWFSQKKPVTTTSDAAGAVRPSAPAAGRPAPAATASWLFERDEELSRLLGMWEQAKAGEGTVVLVAGEAGIGKSSVLSRLVERIADDPVKHRVARASCYAQGGRDEPFWPFADVMKQLVRNPAQSRAEGVLDAVLDIAPSWVSIIPVAGDLVGAGLKTAQVVRDRTKGSPGPSPDKLLREYAGALDKVAAIEPVLIVIDDLHWSDDGSVRLLSHLARAVPSMRVLIAAAYRPSDLAIEGHPLAGLVDELLRYNDDATIELPPLSEPGVAQLVGAAYPGHKIPDEVVSDLHRRTGGAPLFVSESLRLMAQRGELARDAADGRWHITRELSDDDLPPSVEAVVRRRLERLPDPLRRALVMAAVQGTVFETAVLASVLDADELAVLDQLAVAEDPHGIVAYVGDVEAGDELTSRFRFTNTLFQAALVDTLRGKQFVSAHRRTADGIEKLWGQSSDAHAAPLALHYENGRLWEKAADYLILAAQRARRSGETATGIRRFEHAEVLLRRTASGPTMEQQIEIDEGLSYLYDLDSRYADAERRINHALALNVMSPALDWARTTSLNLRLADLTADKGRHAEAAELLQGMYDDLLTAHREQALSLESYRLRAAYSLALTQLGKDDEGIALATESLASLASVPHGVRDPDEQEEWKSVELELSSALAASHFGRGHYRQAIELSNQVLADARALRMVPLCLQIRHRLAEMNLAVGAYAEAHAHLDAMIESSRELGNEAGEATARVVRARTLRLEDDAAGAIAELDRAASLVEGYDWFGTQPQSLAIRAASLIALGRIDEAEPLLAQAADVASTSGVAEWTAYVTLIRARFELASGRFDTAADLAGDAARTFEHEWAYFEQAQALRLAAQAHAAAGNQGTAQHYATQAVALFELIGNNVQAARTQALAADGVAATASPGA